MSFIERNTNSGMDEHYGHLASELLRVTGEELSGKAQVRGRRTSTRNLNEKGDAQSPKSPLVQVPSRPRLSHRMTDSITLRKEERLANSSSGLLKLIAILLTGLLISNVYLYCQLRSMEDQMILSRSPLIALHVPNPEKMKKFISEPSLASATRKHSPSLSRHWKNSSSVSVKDPRRGYPPETSGFVFAGDAAVIEYREGVGLLIVQRRFCKGHVDTVFQFLFTASKFQMDFLALQESFDVNLGQWMEDNNTGEKTRSLSCQVQLNNPFSPKTALSKQNQVGPVPLCLLYGTEY
ncbi:unnamed protein product [Darwinula stevensoni]|uniref:VASt domain-containing protein n=1 Tax=Darwinula stevensoni TaxID=69355 RepID=A0A7R9AG50_9CRUS|nr:unnamed protein product [Darwinula stevensoni]CAG0903638.1 unnamed protein product [Darwinula stevensoni]